MQWSLARWELYLHPVQVVSPEPVEGTTFSFPKWAHRVNPEREKHESGQGLCPQAHRHQSLRGQSGNK